MIIQEFTTASASIELRSGTNGSGATVYVVQQVFTSGRVHQDIFTTEAEARSWIKYAC